MYCHLVLLCVSASGLPAKPLLQHAGHWISGQSSGWADSGRSGAIHKEWKMWVFVCFCSAHPLFLTVVVCSDCPVDWFASICKSVIIMQSLLMYVRSFSASTQVKTSSAWLEQEYPHVGISVWICHSKNIAKLLQKTSSNNNYFTFLFV